MKQLTGEVALALSNLRASKDFGVLVDFLKEDTALEMERCRMLEGVALHRAQGAATKLHDLLQAYVEAPSIFEKVRRQTG